jgi:hypothetical protein
MAKTNQGETEAKPQKDALPLDERMAFSLAEAAEILGVSYTSAFRLHQLGHPRSSGPLRRKIIACSELERFLKT